jgi:hypothetical protein
MTRQTVSRLAVAFVVGAAALSMTFSSSLQAAAHKEGEKPRLPYKMEDMMKKGMKGDKEKGIDSLLKKTLKGTATAKEQKQLLGYFIAIELAYHPERGDAASWKEKTDTLTRAMIGFMAGKPGAVDVLEEAANCKACHKAHKPESK